MMGITTWFTERVLQDTHEDKGLLRAFGLNVRQSLITLGINLGQMNTQIQANRDILAQRTKQLDTQNDNTAVLQATQQELAKRIVKLEQIIVAADRAMQPDIPPPTPTPKKTTRRRTRKTAT